MKKQKTLVYKSLGLANSFNNHIELNKHLKEKKYKSLKNYIVQHELGHDMNRFDLLHEFNINILMLPVLLWFILIHPSTWIDFSPVQYRNKQLIYDANLLMLYGILIIILIITGWFII